MRVPMKHLTLLTAASACVLASLSVVPTPAGANWAGNTNFAHACNGVASGATGVHANLNATSDKAMDTEYVNLDAGTDNAASYVRWNTIPNAGAGLTAPGDPTPTASTDLRIRDGDFTEYCTVDYGIAWYPAMTSAGATTGAITPCVLKTSGGRCDQHTVLIKRAWINNSYMTTGQDRILLCHEIGHAFGLAHREGNTGCMPAGLVRDYPAERNLGYTSHDLVHLEALSGTPSY